MSLNGAGQLFAVGPDDDALLQRLVGDACRTGVGHGTGAGRGLRVRRASGRQPYAVVVSPLVLPHVALLTRRPAAVVFANDLGRGSASPDILHDLFRLTPAEVKVAELLMRGERAGDIAERLQIALPTVRTHIRRLLDKTGARGHPDLVRLLVTAVGGANQAAPGGQGRFWHGRTRRADRQASVPLPNGVALGRC